MATFSSVTRKHVLAALAEYDERGAEEFLARYGFEASGGTVRHEGRTYDARAVLGVAHRYATGRLATAEEFHGDQATGLLSRRGFEVVPPPGAPRAARTGARTTSTTARPPRAPRAPKAPRPAALASSSRAQAAREERTAICTTCFTALPATGVCDTCG